MPSWLFKRPSPEPRRLALGLMSGTSLDGLDAALVRETDNGCVEVIQFASHPLPNDLKHSLNAVVMGQAFTAPQLLDLEVEYTDQVIAQCQVLLEACAEPVSVIGFHGQTLWHAPDRGATWQIGMAERLAEQTGVAVASEFRRGDMARGGQGAPLAPLFHAAHFERDTETVAVLNLGGIANLTVLEPGRAPRGWDVGPANTLSDLWYRRHYAGDFDADGQVAKTGSVHSGLLLKMLQDPYFQASPPKSTGREHFNMAWIERALQGFDALATADVQATLNALTAQSVKQALPDHVDILVSCGGGVENDHLMGCLDDAIDPLLVTSDLFGIDPQAVESACFAWLALQRLSERTLDTRFITGAERSGMLGSIYHPSRG